MGRVETRINPAYDLADFIKANKYVPIDNDVGVIGCDVTQDTYEFGILKPVVSRSIIFNWKWTEKRSLEYSRNLGVIHFAEPPKHDQTGRSLLHRACPEFYEEYHKKMGTWFLRVYGKNNLTEMQELAEKISKKFERNLFVKLASEAEKNADPVEPIGGIYSVPVEECREGFYC